MFKRFSTNRVTIGSPLPSGIGFRDYIGDSLREQNLAFRQVIHSRAEFERG